MYLSPVYGCGTLRLGAIAIFTAENTEITQPIPFSLLRVFRGESTTRKPSQLDAAVAF